MTSKPVYFVDYLSPLTIVFPLENKEGAIAHWQSTSSGECRLKGLTQAHELSYDQGMIISLAFSDKIIFLVDWNPRLKTRRMSYY